MRRLFSAGIVVGLCLILGACANSGSQTGAAPVPGDFRIVFGEGGGFTGRWSGHTVESDRSVSSWEGVRIEENSTAAGQLSEEHRSLLWQQLVETKFFETKMQEKGNMTRLIRVTANGETHEVTWPRSGFPDKEGSPLDELLDFCQTQVLAPDTP